MHELAFNIWDQRSLETGHIRQLRDFFLQIPYDQYYVEFTTERVLVRRASGLPKCHQVDSTTFAEHCKAHDWTAAFDSKTGRNRLVIPCSPHTHFACFVRASSARRFNALIRRIAQETKKTPAKGVAAAAAAAYTHDHDVSWLHVKIPLK